MISKQLLKQNVNILANTGGGQDRAASSGGDSLTRKQAHNNVLLQGSYAPARIIDKESG